MITTPPSIDSLLPIAYATLSASKTIGVDIYICSGPDEPAMLFCAAGESIDRNRLEALTKRNACKLYISIDDRQNYQQCLRDSWQDTLMDEMQPVSHRMSIISEVIRDVLNNPAVQSDTNAIVEQCRLMGSQAARVLSEKPVALTDLMRVLHHDYGTFTHSMNVSSYAVVLARALGFELQDLERIAIGGLLHDIGKLEIDERILNKPSRLDNLERRTIEQHPTLGLLRVIERQDLSEGEFMMIYQHHERIDGSGYPVGVSMEDIHPWAKICAIVDVFEALTSNRPYRRPMSTSTALEILDRGAGTEFDKEMLKCWHQIA